MSTPSWQCWCTHVYINLSPVVARRYTLNLYLWNVATSMRYSQRWLTSRHTISGPGSYDQVFEFVNVFPNQTTQVKRVTVTSQRVSPLHDRPSVLHVDLYTALYMYQTCGTLWTNNNILWRNLIIQAAGQGNDMISNGSDRMMRMIKTLFRSYMYTHLLTFICIKTFDIEVHIAQWMYYNKQWRASMTSVSLPDRCACTWCWVTPRDTGS